MGFWEVISDEHGIDPTGTYCGSTPPPPHWPNCATSASSSSTSCSSCFGRTLPKAMGRNPTRTAALRLLPSLDLAVHSRGRCTLRADAEVLGPELLVPGGPVGGGVILAADQIHCGQFAGQPVILLRVPHFGGHGSAGDRIVTWQHQTRTQPRVCAGHAEAGGVGGVGRLRVAILNVSMYVYTK